MKREEQIKSKIADAIDILTKFGMPPAQLNERTAYCILALTNITPEKDWETEAWIANNPSHMYMVHFNGDKFLGPHKENV